jgi:hypothetical protein
VKGIQEELGTPPRGDNCKNAKILWCAFRYIFSGTTGLEKFKLCVLTAPYLELKASLPIHKIHFLNNP